MLLQWDGVLDRNSSPAALYEIWLQELTTAVMTGHSRAIREALSKLEPAQVLKALRSSQEEIFGEKPAAERNQLLRETLAAAESWCAPARRRPAGWKWGTLHVVRFRHSLDKAAGAEALTDRAPVPRPGDEYTVNATAYFGGLLRPGFWRQLSRDSRHQRLGQIRRGEHARSKRPARQPALS